MSSRPLTLPRVLSFWAPLAGTWLMMAVEGPVLAAVIARLAEPVYNLAAFGVAYSLALIVEAPVIMMLSASTALVRGPSSYRRLCRFAHSLNGLVTAALLLLLLPPLFALVAQGLLGLEPAVAERTHLALVILLPWPGTIGYRRFYQGIMIRYGFTRRVAYGTVVRLLAVAATVSVLATATSLQGSAVGAAALAVGVSVEALASRVMAASALARMRATSEEQVPSFKRILRFYTPLALTSLIGLAMQPMVTFFMGHSRAALESLAVLPVLNSLVFLFRSLGLAAQEVFIALMGDAWEGLAVLRRFARLLGAAVVVSLSLIAWTPLAQWWFVDVSGLAPELAAFALTPVRVLALMPGFTVWLSWQRAMHVNLERTAAVSWATGVELVVAAGLLLMGVFWWGWVGVMAAAVALTVARLMANLLLSMSLHGKGAGVGSARAV